MKKKKTIPNSYTRRALNHNENAQKKTHNQGLVNEVKFSIISLSSYF